MSSHADEGSQVALDPALRGLIDVLDEGVLVESSDGQVVKVNAAFCRLLGLSFGPEEVVGRAFFEVAEEVRRSLQGAEDEPTWRLDGLLRLADGRVVHSRLLEVPSGAGRLWVVTDLTERERSAQAIRESEANLVALIESSEDMFWSVDRELRLVTFNQAFAANFRRAFGVDPRVGGGAVELLPREDRVHWAALYRHALAGNRMAAEDAFPGPRGTLYYEMSLNPIIADGEATGVAVHSRDVTERRRNAEAMRQAVESAESANRAKSDFLANMSHEIRTPLNAIIGMGELALSTELNPVQREYLRTVRSNSEALLNLINDILDFSKIEAGQMGVDAAPFRAHELIEEVVAGLGERAFAKGLDLRLDIKPALPSLLMGDARHLRQVLTNLLSNAIKYTQEGWVVVRARAEPKRGVDGVVLVLEVEDSGVGISERDHDRVFHKFFRSTGEQASGTGLGLSITRSLVQLMGGEVRLESTPAKGSRFRVDLPLPVHELDDPGEAAWRRMVGERRVMLVGPDANERATQRRTLEPRGVEVVEASGLAEAREALSRGAFDALCVDARVSLADIRALIDAAHGGYPDGGCSDGGLSREARPRTLIVLLTPLGATPGPLLKLKGLSARLNRPVRRQHLFEAIAGLRGESIDDSLAARAGPGAAPAEPVESRRILLVEDNHDNQVVAMATLHQGGHTAELARDGVEAVEISEKGGFDLILMDIHMPRMDGVEATRRIRERERDAGLSRVPIVALTAHATQDFQERCLAAGADAFLTKPIVPGRLLKTISELARREHVLLIVDDVASNRQLLGHYLRSTPGYTLLFARHGREALDLAQRRSVSLVLLDMEMPVLNGHDTAIAMRSLPGWGDTPIVAITGHAGPDARRRSLDAGCIEHVVKPVRRGPLLELVARLLGPRPDEDTGSSVMIEEPMTTQERVPVRVSAVHQAALPALLGQVRQELGLIRGHLVAGRYGALMELAAARKDEARSFGVTDLTRAFRALERAARREDSAQVRRAAMDLLRLLEDLEIEWV